jgi:hypothetical protein
VVFSVGLRPKIVLFLRRLEGQIRGLAENPPNIVSRVRLGLTLTHYPNPTRSGRGPASAGLDRGFRPVEGLNRQNFSDLLPAKQFCCRPGQLLIICAGGVGLRKSKMSSWRQGDDEKASMQGPVPTVQRNGNRRFVTTVSGRLLLLRILEPPKAAS